MRLPLHACVHMPRGSPSPPASPPPCTSGRASSCAHTSAPHPPRSHPQLRAPHIPRDKGKRRKDVGGLWKVPPRAGVAAAPSGTRQGHGTEHGARIICSNCDGKPQEFAVQKVCREVNRRPNSLQVRRGIGSSGCFSWPLCRGGGCVRVCPRPGMKDPLRNVVRKTALVASRCPSGSRGLGKCAEPARSRRGTG